MVKRCRQVKVHVLIIDYLRGKFGRFGRKKKQEELLNDLLTHFKAIQKMYDLPVGDFPHMSKFRDTIVEMNIWEFPALDKKKLEKLDWVLSTGIPELIRTIPSINEQSDLGHSPSNQSMGPNDDVSTHHRGSSI
uniref:EH domain-containing protein 4 n=1 Tax=Lygus hesperus TaxID=30085 RepID=A0A0A9W009_LYGHE